MAIHLHNLDQTNFVPFRRLMLTNIVNMLFKAQPIKHQLWEFDSLI